MRCPPFHRGLLYLIHRTRNRAWLKSCSRNNKSVHVHNYRTQNIFLFKSCHRSDSELNISTHFKSISSYHNLMESSSHKITDSRKGAQCMGLIIIRTPTASVQSSNNKCRLIKTEVQLLTARAEYLGPWALSRISIWRTQMAKPSSIC
jgi:hypothetical protein